jgi:hypothetical protein
MAPFMLPTTISKQAKPAAVKVSRLRLSNKQKSDSARVDFGSDVARRTFGFGLQGTSKLTLTIRTLGDTKPLSLEFKKETMVGSVQAEILKKWAREGV